MIKYVTTNYSTNITAIVAERETDASIWINGYRRAKKSTRENYFSTFSEAKRFLMEKHRKRVQLAKDSLKRKNKDYVDVFALTEQIDDEVMK